MRAMPIAVSCLALAVLSFQGAQDEKTKKPYKVGAVIKEEIELVDLDGKKRMLLEECDDQYIVFVFWALRDPMSHAYLKRLAEFQKEFAVEDVKLFLIDANYDEIFAHSGKDPLKKIRDFVKKEKLELTLLIDHGNKVADDFGALTSNHAFLLGKKRVFKYAGSVDDDPKQVLGERAHHYLQDAMNAVLKGEKIAYSVTRPKGKKIKRAPKVEGKK